MITLPDLTVVSYETEYTDEGYEIKAVIGNIGRAKSSSTLAYFDAISHVCVPGVNPIRIQEHRDIPEIEAGMTVELEPVIFDLAKLHAQKVDCFEICVDPKIDVWESNEYNNIERWNWPY